MACSPIFRTPEYDAFRRAFGYNLRLVRKARKISWRKMAFLAGYSLKKYEMVECGRKLPNLERAARLAAILEVPLSTLVPKSGRTEFAPKKRSVLLVAGKLGSTRVVTIKKKRKKRSKKPVEKLSKIRSRSSLVQQKNTLVK